MPKITSGNTIITNKGTTGNLMDDKMQEPGDNVVIREVRNCDRERIIAIFNYYAETSYAAYPEIPVDERFFSFLREGSLGFYVLEHDATVVGFGLVKPLLPFPVFMKTGMLTYFIQPEYTHRRLGKKLLDRLSGDAKKMGMTSLVANMASENKVSIRFHLHSGFTEVGRLHNAGRKFGESFDLIWMQRIL
jgi:L-amino acid N-acyltransferase